MNPYAENLAKTTYTNVKHLIQSYNNCESCIYLNFDRNARCIDDNYCKKQ